MFDLWKADDVVITPTRFLEQLKYGRMPCYGRWSEDQVEPSAGGCSPAWQTDAHPPSRRTARYSRRKATRPTSDFLTEPRMRAPTACDCGSRESTTRSDRRGAPGVIRGLRGGVSVVRRASPRWKRRPGRTRRVLRLGMPAQGLRRSSAPGRRSRWTLRSACRAIASLARAAARSARRRGSSRAPDVLEGGGERPGPASPRSGDRVGEIGRRARRRCVHSAGCSAPASACCGLRSRGGGRSPAGDPARREPAGASGPTGPFLCRWSGPRRARGRRRRCRARRLKRTLGPRPITAPPGPRPGPPACGPGRRRRRWQRG